MKTLIKALTNGTKKELTTVKDDVQLLFEVEKFEDLFFNEEENFYTDCDGNFDFKTSDNTLDFDDYKYFFINENNERIW